MPASLRQHLGGVSMRRRVPLRSTHGHKILRIALTLIRFARRVKGEAATVPWSFCPFRLGEFWARDWGRRVREAAVVRAAERVLLRAELWDMTRERLRRVIGAQRFRSGQAGRRRGRSDRVAFTRTLQISMNVQKSSKNLEEKKMKRVRTQSLWNERFHRESQFFKSQDPRDD